MPQFESLNSLINECFLRYSNEAGKWYEGYKRTHQAVLEAESIDDILELLWYQRDNSVSSLKQGMPSKTEFEQARPFLMALTREILAHPDEATYEQAVNELNRLKQEGIFRQYYGALLNRVFGAIAPDKVTSCTKDGAFLEIARLLNDAFGLGIHLNGNWYQNNVELKTAFKKRFPNETDDFKINISVWHAYQMLEEEKQSGPPLSVSEQKIKQVLPDGLTSEQYQEVLQSDGVLNEASKTLLSALYHAPHSTATAPQLAHLTGQAHFAVVNATIGKLGKRIASYFNLDNKIQDLDNARWWPLVADGVKTDQGFTWSLKDKLKTALESLGLIDSPSPRPPIKEVSDQLQEAKIVSKSAPSLNRIFYGPPGTGKTYRSIEAAVRAAEPLFNGSTRKELKAKYDELVSQQRIQFVTFHQSYGYEEFVEGLRAFTEDGQVSYEVQSGIFKRLCTVATNNMIKSKSQAVKHFESCWDAFLDGFDEDNGVKVPTKKSWFRITEVTDNTIHFEKANGASKHTLAIKTLKAIFNETKVVKGGLNVYYQPLVAHLKSYAVNDNAPKELAKNFVLIIDEINRGNISKIFGELITLIEESKRSYGASDEAIEVLLPYSGDSFSVPANLYLIGTMNTADRSLALMDTALRRRFDFEEMTPDYALLSGKAVKNVQLQKLLKTLNARIEALYDREHSLGQAFFMPVLTALDCGDETKAFQMLKQVFLGKIIPLLEEYFFDDWNKIRLVLGDNQKSESLQFVQQVTTSYDDLFGSNHGLDSYTNQTHSFELASPSAGVWSNPLAYQAIYAPASE